MVRATRWKYARASALAVQTSVQSVIFVLNGESMKQETRLLIEMFEPKFFRDTPANCQAIWRKQGWVPPTEYRTDYFFAHKHGTKLNGKPKRKPGPKGPWKYGAKK
jgi:hypothetical protein